jgi:hypothetical protein
MERCRRFHEACFGFGARSARRNDDVLMLYNAEGFGSPQGCCVEPLARPG